MFDWLFGPSETDRKLNQALALLRLTYYEVQIIMATQAEVVATLAAVQARLDAVGVEVAKVGAETDGLIQAVADLQAVIAAGGQSTPELDAAVAAVQASADALAAAVQVVDDKVADVPAP